jgi:hypothetical protein
VSDSKENRVTRQVRIYTDLADWMEAECVRLRSVHGRKFVPAEVADSLWKSAAKKALSAEGTAAPSTISDSSPLDQLTPDEISLALGLVAGLRQKDLIISGAVQMLKTRIAEKGYELKPETTSARQEHPRRKIAG